MCPKNIELGIEVNNMNIFVVLILMIFAHIIDDYYLQGILAKLKQKAWWRENEPDEMYKHDYICALLTHSFSWATMIFLPILFATNFNPHWSLIALFVPNITLHFGIDNAKANEKIINLWTDQILHFIQIIALWAVFVVA